MLTNRRGPWALTAAVIGLALASASLLASSAGAAAAQLQISDFLEPDGAVVNVCGGTPCHSSVYVQ